MEKGKAVMGMGRRWAVDFTDNSTSPSSRDIPDPPGFTRASQDQDDSTVSREKKNAESNWKAQKAWEVAQAPFKNLMMMGFMMWMAGSTVHLFSIGITFSALWQPISALQGVGKVFEPYKDSKVDLLGPKLLFIALNLAGLGLGIWKLNTLGLLPTHPSDWVSSLPPPQEVEYSGGDSSIVLGFIYETLLKDYKLYLHQEGYNFDQTTKSKQQFSNVSLCLPRYHL
nr:ER membrane protein complex subunit 4-like [Ipomoea batatas]